MGYGAYSTTMTTEVDVDVIIPISDIVEEATDAIIDCLRDNGYRVIKIDSLMDNFKLDFIIENLQDIKLEDLEKLV